MKALYGECPKHLTERASGPRNEKGESECTACVREHRLKLLTEFADWCASYALQLHGIYESPLDEISARAVHALTKEYS